MALVAGTASAAGLSTPAAVLQKIQAIASRLGLRRTTRLLFHWRADFATVESLAGFRPVFSRNVTATANDSANVSYTARPGQPAFDWYDTDSDGVYETPTLLLDTSDVLYWPFRANPRTMTVYVQFIEAGTVGTASDRVLLIGEGATAPFLSLHSNGTNYLVTHDNNDGSAVSSTQAVAPTTGQRVEIRAVLNADGSVICGQSIDEGTETVAATSGANTLQAAWSGQKLYLNSAGVTNVGTNAFRVVKVAVGVRSMSQMRVAF